VGGGGGGGGFTHPPIQCGAGIAQSVERLAKGWTFWGSNPGEVGEGAGEIFLTCTDRPTQPPTQCVKRPGRGVDHLTPSSAEVKERVQLYAYSTSGPMWPVLGWTLPVLKIYQSSFPGLKRPEREADHSLSSAIFTNECSYTYVPSIHLNSVIKDDFTYLPIPGSP